MENGKFGMTIPGVYGGEVLYFASKEVFNTARLDAAFHGKNVLAYAQSRTVIGELRESCSASQGREVMSFKKLEHIVIRYMALGEDDV